MALLSPETDSAEPSPLVALTRNPRKIAKKTLPVSGVDEYASALHLLDVEHRKLRTGFADHLGLTHNEYDAFMFIAEQRSTTPKELAATLRFTTGATTAMIDRLENVDLVHRIPNPDDRRSILIEPTPHGQSQAGWVISTYTRLAAEGVSTHATLTPEQLTETVTHITSIITDRIRKIAEDA
ncbi:MarR family winged helix-turn-helix transcriptional regulator [Subtercola boreus]|nr:MarR family winged helix-turn-helix transcriptional regulator [Subtercola boreus]